MLEVVYGRGFHRLMTLLSQADTKLHKTTPTLAAGDFKVKTMSQALTTLTAKQVAFTSGSEEPLVGDSIKGHTSNATAVVVGVELSSGSWGGGDAAGTLIVGSDSGTFQSEDLDNTSAGTTNFATIGGALGAAGLVREVTSGNGLVAVGCTAAEATTRMGYVTARDASGAEWCDDGFEFITTDHPNAGKPNGCVWVATLTDTGQTTTNIRLPATPTLTLRKGMFFVAEIRGQVQCGQVSSIDTGTGYNIVPVQALDASLVVDANGNSWTLRVYQDAKSLLAYITGKESTVALSTQEKADVNAEADTALSDAGIASAIAALNDLSAADVLAAAYEGSETLQDFLRLARAALVGKASGLDTATATFRDAADTKDRITATVDADGNRSAVTVDPT